MLKREEAQRQLRAWTDQATGGTLGQRLNRLPKAVRDDARLLVGVDRRIRDTDWQTTRLKSIEAAARFDALDAAAREAAFATMYPKLAPYMEATWQRMKREPHSGTLYDGQVVPFRCPESPASTLEARGVWLTSLCESLGKLDMDIQWVAAWTPHLAYYGAADSLGRLLAGALDLGGDTGGQVYQTLIDSAKGEHEVGTMGRHITRALLSAGREDGWAFVEKLLLAAQRQEGLRQVILETCDLAHPDAFQRMLRLILDENLVRFASVARAVDCWFALQWDSASTGVIKKAVEFVARYLDDEAARRSAVESGKAEEVYFALWATAFYDAEQALPLAAGLLEHDKVELRFTGAWVLSLLGLNVSVQALIPALDDTDLRVAAVANHAVRIAGEDERSSAPGTFDGLERLIERVPKKPAPPKPLLWPWLQVKLTQAEVADAMAACVPDDQWGRLVPYVPRMSPSGRYAFVAELEQRKQWPAEARELLLALVGDPSGTVREQAIKLLTHMGVEPGEAEPLEALLRRKAGDLRRGVLSLLRKLPDEAALASTDRLLAAGDELQRLAGLEQLAAIVERKALGDAGRERARQYAEARQTLSEDERKLLVPLLNPQAERPTLKDGLGLFDPAKLTPPKPLQSRGTLVASNAALGLLASLDDFVHAHREMPVTVDLRGDKQQTLLGNAEYGLRRWDSRRLLGQADEAFPFAEMWMQWYEQRPAELRDDDGFELIRAAAITLFIDWQGRLSLRTSLLNDFVVEPNEGERRSGIVRGIIKRLWGGRDGTNVSLPTLKHGEVVADVTHWLARQHAQDGLVDFLLDAAETAMSKVPAEFVMRRLRGDESLYTVWLRLADQTQAYMPTAWSDEQRCRLVGLQWWFDQPVDANGRSLISDISIQQEAKHMRHTTRPLRRRRLAGHALGQGVRRGLLNEHDVYETLLCDRPDEPAPISYHSQGYDALRELTARKTHPAIKACPRLGELVTRARERIVEVELTRGDEPTDATDAAMAIRCLPAMRLLVSLLKAMGETPFQRGYTYSGGRDRKTVFSHLVRVSMPAESDTAEALTNAVNQAGIGEKRLVETAVFAPQWARLIEHALGWEGLEDAVWWIHAHTRDDQWSVDHEIREAWSAEVAERTPLASDELLGGAVDVRWFERAYQRMGKKRWQQVHAAAKNASSAGGHTRAQLYADAMLGRLTKTELVRRIDEKRHKEAVQALGLLPLARGSRWEKDLLDRYERMQAFIRTSRQFGQQRQASEKRAAEIGQANLARSAGYADPLRLQWAMEAKAVADLAAGPVAVTAGETTVTLAVADTGDPTLTVEKNGRTLNSLPAAAMKDRRIVELRDRRTQLKRQASRMRLSLEQMMCQAQPFTGRELAELTAHPLMRPMLERLVVLGEGIAGYPDKGGKLLIDHAGQAEPVKATEQLRLAHPHDLLKRGDWSMWQRDCFARERMQPFKQVFRELYVLTNTERNNGTHSSRYAGQQVNPRQALALLGSRGWVVRPEEGVRRTFHDHQLSAWLEFQETFYTPAEVDGLTLENVRFSKAGEWQSVSMESVPPLVFSEVMRDMDLVVSVAHRAGVDPEASASTVEMRSDLLRETLAVLSMENVRIENNHALIEGNHANYSVHLGSAVTHVMPGGSLFIVPVHSQHRGRMFLPFADDDAKTAEVLSKVLLLARDCEIKDPNILDQIRLLT